MRVSSLGSSRLRSHVGMQCTSGWLIFHHQSSTQVIILSVMMNERGLGLKQPGMYWCDISDMPCSRVFTPWKFAADVEGCQLFISQIHSQCVRICYSVCNIQKWGMANTYIWGSLCVEPSLVFQRPHLSVIFSTVLGRFRIIATVPRAESASSDPEHPSHFQSSCR